MRTAAPSESREVEAPVRPKAPIRATLRKVRPLFVLVVVVAVLYAVVNTVVSLYTNWLWFGSLHESSVYSRRLLTQIVMFAVFGGATALAVAVNLFALHRHTPYGGDAPTTRFSVRLRYGRLVYPRRHLVTVVAALVAGIWLGSRAARQWPLWLQWRNATSFGVKDPQFHRDYSYYVFVYPMHRFALGAVFTIVLLCLVLLGVMGYLNGGFRPRGQRPRLRAEMRVHLCLLLGALALLKAFGYWLDRLATAVSNRGVVTGPSYTDIHAVLPSKLILLVIAVILAVLFFINAAFRSWKVTAAGVVTLALSGVVLGGVVPWVVQTYHVKPDAQDAEALSIARDLVATRYGYGIGSDTVTTGAAASPQQMSGAAVSAAVAAAQPQLLDPNQMSPTFTQLQQVRAFYGFKSTLDTDRYPLGGATRDVALAVRELNPSGLPSGQRTWSNLHLVYTHGYGVVAAPVDDLRGGTPNFVESDIPPTGGLGSYEPRIYFGQSSPSYSIVGAPPGARPHEFDRPATGSGQVTNTYHGLGGVRIGSFWRRLAFAWQLGDKNILFSKGINKYSRLLSIRDPRQRVQQVAPWLTVDGAAYPVVAGGRVLWVVDGYTTANSVPYSQQQNLAAAASDTYVTNGSSSAQSNQSINYIRNSVKATVDAYDGTVHLYRWDTETGLGRDPVLATWMKAFPGLVRPAAALPSDVRAHLRYPRDLFNVQRTMLARYHVTDPRSFYNGSDFWLVPSDPTMKGSAAQPSYYLRLPGAGGTQLALTTSFVSLNGRTMTAYLSVGSDPGPGYGRMQLQTLPAGVEGPGQIRNDIESDPGVAQQLTLLRGGGSRVVLGNLQPIPVDGDVIWVEPIYSRAAGGTSFPILRRVVVARGGTIAFEPTLDLALADAVGNGSTPSARLAQAVAAAQQAQARAQAALAANNRAEYERQERLLEAALATIAASQPNG
ncbi:MAG TPA: UPF0182 family protein [Mycobacteriales bacterium]|nr:UPF0182 family protein [Mycobacteriales bacterium]